MITFAVQVAGVALAAGLVASALLPLVGPLIRRLAAGRRADAQVVAGALPMAVAAGLAVALVVPTALDLFGVEPDHCVAHAHGLHLCGVHGGVHLPLLVLGAMTLAVALVRGADLAAGLLRASADVRALEALGVQAGPLVEVPGDAPLCHATGVLRPRILLSAGLRGRLGATAVRAALAHEHAHLRRRDPAALVFLQAASIFALPGLSQVSAFRASAEEAADAEAAAEVGALTVADALVRLARLVRDGHARPPTAALAFVAHPLEHRVHLLLSGPVAPGTARGLVLALATGLVSILLGAVGAEPIHHLVEDVLLGGH